MKNCYLWCFLMLLSSFSTSAQYTHFDWVKTFDSDPSSAENGRAITTDVDGNVYTVGHFSRMMDFNPNIGIYNLNSSGSSTYDDVFIQKMDSNGLFQWAKAINSNGSIFAITITADPWGNLYIAGRFSSRTDFNPDSGIHYLYTSGSDDAFVLKLNDNGQFINAYCIGGSDDQMINEIKTDLNGNVYVTGHYSQLTDFDPDTSSYLMRAVGNSDVFVAKYDSVGKFIWAKSIGGVGHNRGNGLFVDSIGNVIVVGSYTGTADFDPGPGIFNLRSNNSYDAFVVKLDTIGNLEWAKSLGSNDLDAASKIVAEPGGESVIIGYYSDTINFDPGASNFSLISNGKTDVFVLKLKSNGDFKWAKSFGGTDGDGARSILLDSSQNIYISGVYMQTVDFDPGAGTFNFSSKGEEDIFILKLQSNGDFSWAKSQGGDKQDYCWSMSLDPFDNLFTTGMYSTTVDFDPGLLESKETSSGSGDIYIQRFKSSSCPEISGTHQVHACSPYTWLDGKTYFNNNNTAVFNIEGGATNGCDSIALLDLSMHFINARIAVSNGALRVNVTGATYQWLDCDNNYAPVAGANGQSFTPLTNGNYAVDIQEKWCRDTTECQAFTFVGVAKNSLEDELIVYPNPTSTNIQLDLGRSYSDVTLTLTNTLGQEVYRNTFPQLQQMELPIVGASGVYVFRIQTQGGKSAVVRVLKE